MTVNQLVEIAGVKLKRNYDLSAPKGVKGRNSDNTLIKKYLNWELNTPLRVGLEKTYQWIYDQYLARESNQPKADLMLNSFPSVKRTVKKNGPLSCQKSIQSTRLLRASTTRRLLQKSLRMIGVVDGIIGL